MSIARDFYITDDRHFLERFFLSLDFINALLLRNSPFSILSLLIVPYGIETYGNINDVMAYQAFNCTLWN